MPKSIFVDKEKCVGCYSCIVACKMEHNLPPFVSEPPVAEPKGPELIKVYEVGPEVRDDGVSYYFQPISCMHCLDAPCVKVCPSNALHKDPETSMTRVYADKCIGCKLCSLVCPFGVPQYYNDKMLICDLCQQRRNEDGYKKTACEAVCPAQAIKMIDVKEYAQFKGLQVAKMINYASEL